VIVQGNECLPAPAFLGPGLVPLVGKKVIERRQEKRAELALLGTDIFEEAPLEQMSKKTLSQILRIVRATALASHVGVERIPVGAAQFFQRFDGVRCGGLSRGQNNAPMRAVELACASVERIACLRLGHHDRYSTTRPA